MLAFPLRCLTLLTWVIAVSGLGAQEPEKRVPWTTSRVKGTPEPPHPYRLERAFPNLTFREPVFMVRAPGLDRWFVGNRPGKIVSFKMDPRVEKPDLFVDLPAELRNWDPRAHARQLNCYALVFHPQFQKNRYCYVCYVHAGKSGDLQDGTRISRFKVTDTDPPRLDPASETIIITFLGGGHNGCDLHFGPDGFLYISTGDGTGPYPPDGLGTGQDLSDLLSSILRIDVDRTENGKPYAVPADNPFLKTPRARPEIWAYGFRNPWRMSFDRVTGDLWVGDVGWELWELVHRVKKGGNYGWSVKEGRQDVRPDGPRGPTPILPPTLDFPHTEAASITGGYVYRGKRYPDLAGAYICGDWVSRKVWATKFDGDRIVWHKEIAHGNARVVAFAEDQSGELHIVHHDDQDGALYTLVPNEAARDFKDTFPRKLSETGLFSTTADHSLAPGVMPFEINAEQWVDHARAERFVAFPGTSTAKLFDNWVRVESEFYGSYTFPPRDGVLGKTLSIEMEHGNPASRKRLETQILHFDGKHCRGYTYVWNDAQTDAELLDARGKNITLNIVDATAPEGKRRQTWHFPSRTECMTCHNPWSGFALAFTPHQLQRDVVTKGKIAEQVEFLRGLGIVELMHRDWRKEVPLEGPLPTPLVDPHDPRADLARRARSYLHVNCSHCHQFGGGGSADLDFRHITPLEKAKVLGVPPVQGNFGIPDARILAPGDPYRSMVYYRMAKLGRGHMPHIGSEIVDERALALMHDWIRSLPPHADAWALLERLRFLDEETALEREKREARNDIAEASQRAAVGKGRATPSADDVKQAEERYAQQCARRAKERPAERADVIRKLLATPHAALVLMQQFNGDRRLNATRPEVVKLALDHPDPQVRDLFERFAPDSRRVERLGTLIVPEKLLAFAGDEKRGRDLFFQPTFQCGNCHSVRGQGGQVGPDLTQVAQRLSRVQILENILEPSKIIEPKYLTYVAETTSGQLHTGLLLDKNAKEVVLRQVGNKDVRLAAADVVSLTAQKTSLMPEQLLRDATPQQAADLLSFLQSLK